MEGCCDVPAFAPCRAWCSVILEGADPEEAEYLVPEANIRLRPVGKYPHGCRGRGHLSVAAVLWHTWLVPLSRSVPLQLSIYPALLWFSEVYLLLTHPVSSQPVLCHRTHGTTQQGSDSCLTASSPCTGRGRVRRCRFKRVVRAQEHKLLGFFFIQSHFMQMKTLNCIQHTTSPSKHRNEGWMKIQNSYIQIYRSPFSTF